MFYVPRIYRFRGLRSWMEGYKQPRLVSWSDGEQIFLRCSAAYNGREFEIASIWEAWLKTPQLPNQHLRDSQIFLYEELD